jgi:hypothetical protein
MLDCQGPDRHLRPQEAAVHTPEDDPKNRDTKLLRGVLDNRGGLGKWRREKRAPR